MMARTPEAKVKDEVRKIFKDRDIWFYQPVQNGMGRVGIPDFICCWNGRMIAIETKAPGKLDNTTPNQEKVMDEIRLAGGYAMVVDSGELLTKVLDAIQMVERLES